MSVSCNFYQGARTVLLSLKEDQPTICDTWGCEDRCGMGKCYVIWRGWHVLSVSLHVVIGLTREVFTCGSSNTFTEQQCNISRSLQVHPACISSHEGTLVPTPKELVSHRIYLIVFSTWRQQNA